MKLLMTILLFIAIMQSHASSAPLQLMDDLDFSDFFIRGRFVEIWIPGDEIWRYHDVRALITAQFFPNPMNSYIPPFGGFVRRSYLINRDQPWQHVLEVLKKEKNYGDYNQDILFFLCHSSGLALDIHEDFGPNIPHSNPRPDVYYDVWEFFSERKNDSDKSIRINELIPDEEVSNIQTFDKAIMAVCNFGLKPPCPDSSTPSFFFQDDHYFVQSAEFYVGRTELRSSNTGKVLRDKVNLSIRENRQGFLNKILKGHGLAIADVGLVDNISLDCLFLTTGCIIRRFSLVDSVQSELNLLPTRNPYILSKRIEDYDGGVSAPIDWRFTMSVNHIVIMNNQGETVSPAGFTLP